jgi:hypothetical protein
MIAPSPMQSMLNDLIAALRLHVALGDQAYGEVQGSPVTMTVLGDQPPALLFAFPVQVPQTANDVPMPDDVGAFLRETAGSVSVEKGILWLSLDNLAGKSAEAVAAFVERFGVALAELGLRVPPGCLKCGSSDELQMLYIDRRCSRICAACRDAVDEEVEAKIADAVRPHVGFAACTPLVFLGVSIGWAISWFSIEMYLEANHTNKLAILDFLPALAFLAAVAGVMGWPLGLFLRRSGLARPAPLVVAAVTVVLACVLGEWLFVNALVVHRFGLTGPLLGTQLFLPYVFGYSGSWFFAKILVAGAILLGCGIAVRIRPTIAAPRL